MDIRTLEANLRDVRRRMADACERADRTADEVRLVAVTKTVDPVVARALIDLGVRDIGENRVQEAQRKHEELSGLDIAWHMIGHLQRNKVKYAFRIFELIHSVDSPRLARAISKRAEFEGREMPVLVQVNTSGEDSKYGLPAESAVEAIRVMAELPNLRIRGLMTMAPFVDDPETVRPVFVRLRELADEVAGLGLEGVEMAHLSMGMTQDFEVAIEEGATIVRVGSALFRGVTD